MDSPPLSPAARMAMTRAAERGEQLGHGYLGVEHLFLALVSNPTASFREAFEEHDIALDGS